MSLPESKPNGNGPSDQSVSADLIRDTILQRVDGLEAQKSVGPPEIARALVGTNEKTWRKLMKPIRQEAVELAKQGRLLILRKGNPVDPDNFKGVYRMGQAK